LCFRLDTIEDELTDERAELVATAGILNQNDKLREQIQQEEREKMKVEFESELQKAKQNLDLERQNVRETLDSEYQGERDRLKSEIKLLRSLLHAEETKNAELSGRNKQATEYAEDLESRLVASEVEKEELQVEVTRLKQEAEDMKLKHEEELQREVQAREQLETTSKEGQKTVEAYKGDMLRHVEEAKYEMFRQLMDVFEKERAVLEKAHSRTQELLTLAAKVGSIVLRCGCVF
jgi:chromosome segregation ATPase